jgi:DNA repair protein XRS2
LEQLDIKYSADYASETTHVVSKKRNTSKGLQALINGKYVVTDSFINAVVDAATVPDEAGDGASSALEEDFEASWPNAIDHLPPRGEEPSERPPEAYAPDSRRQEVFDGYTFVFYEKKQYENLFPVVTSGKGKALLKEVVARETDVDDFIRYVKGVAGEKGLGSFVDGSEGKGVVVVRYIPKGDDYEWFAQFLTSFAQRLDHRPMDQREFLEAILAGNASMLRRPLEEASQPESAAPQSHGAAGGTGDRMDIDQPPRATPEDEEPVPAARVGRGRRTAGRARFRGFDFDDAEEPVEETPPVEPPQPPPAVEASQDSMFVSQYREPSLSPDEEVRETRATGRTLRKRSFSPLPEHDTSELMAAIAPTAAAAKRRRIESGQPAMPPPPAPEPAPQPDEDEEMASDSPQGRPKRGQAAKGKGKKIKVEDDILELARRQREEAEAQAAAKRRELEELPDDGIDYAAIRALHIIEECEVRLPAAGANSRNRDQDIADGRWDPRWNGRKNFKRFRKQGEQAGRTAPRIIIGLEEVKPKEYGIGDDYWLEDVDSSSRRRKDSPQQQQQQQQRGSQTQTTTQQQQQASHSSTSGSLAKGKAAAKPAMRRTVVALDSSDEEEASELATPVQHEDDSVVPETEPSRSRTAKAAEKANSQRATRTQTQTQTQSQVASSSSKRSAPATDAAPAAKRPRRGFRPPSDDESDGSDDELKFRFGRRR